MNIIERSEHVYLSRSGKHLALDFVTSEFRGSVNWQADDAAEYLERAKDDMRRMLRKNHKAHLIDIFDREAP